MNLSPEMHLNAVGYYNNQAIKMAGNLGASLKFGCDFAHHVKEKRHRNPCKLQERKYTFLLWYNYNS